MISGINFERVKSFSTMFLFTNLVFQKTTVLLSSKTNYFQRSLELVCCGITSMLIILIPLLFHPKLIELEFFQYPAE